MPKRSADEKLYMWLYGAFLCVYFAALFYLFRAELTVYPTDPDFRFESDTYVHVIFAIKNGYFHSLSAFIYILLSKLPFMYYTIPCLLSFMTVGAVVLVKRLIEVLPGEEKIPAPVVYIISTLSNFAMGFYLPFVNRQHYIGYENANMWHNSTYIFMRFFAVLTVIVFVKLYRSYKDGIDVKSFCLYTLLLTVTTGFKASFFTVFAPFLAILLLRDLIKKAKFLRVFVMACSVIPSFVVLVLQSLVLFAGEEKASIVFAPFKTFSERGDHPKVSLIVSILFLIVVLAFNIPKLKSDGIYAGSILFFVIGFTEALLLAESGARDEASNFMWGYSITLYFAFIIAARRAYLSFLESGKKLPVFLMQTGVFLWHAVSGAWHFVLLLLGFTFFK